MELPQRSSGDAVDRDRTPGATCWGRGRASVRERRCRVPGPVGSPSPRAADRTGEWPHSRLSRTAPGCSGRIPTGCGRGRGGPDRGAVSTQSRRIPAPLQSTRAREPGVCRGRPSHFSADVAPTQFLRYSESCWARRSDGFTRCGRQAPTWSHTNPTAFLGVVRMRKRLDRPTGGRASTPRSRRASPQENPP